MDPHDETLDPSQVPQDFARRVLDNLFAFVGILDLDGTLIEANRAPLEAAGITLADVRGKKFWDCYWWSYDRQIQVQLRDACARAAAGEVVRYEVRVRMAGDSRMLIAFQLAPLRDETGRITHLVPSGVDLTERQRVERQLREREALFREMVNGLPLIVWMHDADGEQEMVNDTYCEFFGVRREEVKGDRWQVLMHPDDPETEAYAQEFFECVRERRNFHGEVRVQRADGDWRWLESWGRPRFTEDGEYHGFVGTSADVTDRKRAEEALRRSEERLREADRRKDEYLAMLGHELRNPLAAIQSAVELVKLAGEGQPRLQRASGVLERQTASMTRLIEGLLDVSRIARGKVELELETVDLGRVCREVVEDRNRTTGERGLEVDLDLPAEPVWVSGDLVRLSQVVDNLVGNALKFTPGEGEVRVVVEEDGPEAVVRVRDTGVGIREEILPRVFEPFLQEDQGMSRDHGGLGLGLALARGLVELHGGTIRAHSGGRGTGSEMVVRLPRTGPPAEEGSAPAAAGTGASRRILIVEDNHDAAQALRDLLELQGHAPRIAQTGAQALELLRRQEVDLVLCDIGLPGMSGYDFARRVREDGALPDVPLVALTGYGQPDDKQRAREAGFQTHLTKPVDLSTLRRVLAGLEEEGADPFPTRAAGGPPEGERP